MAISYDAQPVLAKFASKRGIRFPLLSDAGSRTIDAWGVRNPEVRGGRIDGVPYPGTFVLDAHGVVRAKLFHEGYKERHSAREILDAAAAMDRAQPAAD